MAEERPPGSTTVAVPDASASSRNANPNAQNVLVKFDPPITIYSFLGQNAVKFMNAFAMQKNQRDEIISKLPKPGAGVTCEDISMEDRQIEEILDAIIPPAEWEEDGRVYRQLVSPSPALRIDLIALQEKLDYYLKQRQAREDGICPLRRELYSQCFDELIRQATIESPERGLLLVRVRDEIRMSLSAYQELYESAAVFGTHKTQKIDYGQEELHRKKNAGSQQKQELEKLVQELKVKLELSERTYQEQKEADDKKHWEDMQFAKRAHQLLKQQLERLTSWVPPTPEEFELHKDTTKKPLYPKGTTKKIVCDD